MIPFAAFTFRQVTAGRNAGIRVIGAIIIIIFPVHLKSLHLKKCIIKLPTLTRLLSLSDGCLLGGLHLLNAITANDVHGFCGAYALVTAGANIFAGAAGLLGLGDCSVACPFGECSNYIPQADRLAHLKVLPALFLDEIQQRKSGACNRPSVFWMLLNAKPVAFGNLLILPIVVKVPGTTGIFDTFFCRQTMAHLMQKRTASVFYRAAKCGAADVDFIPPLVSCLPNLKGTPPTLQDFYRLLQMQPEPEAQGLALSSELFITGTLNTFARHTNVDTQARIIAYDIRELGEQLMPLGMLVTLDAIYNRVIQNWKKGRRTWIFCDEFYILFRYEYSANFFYKLWKRIRKYNGLVTGLTQNVDELLRSDTARLMLANSEFLVMLNQSATDRAELAKLLNISDNQLGYVTNVPAGCGLIRCAGNIVPFTNSFPKNTKLYGLMTTKPDEVRKE